MNLFESLNCEGLRCSQESSSRPGRMSKCWFSKISTSRRLLAKQQKFLPGFVWDLNNEVMS